MAGLATAVMGGATAPYAVMLSVTGADCVLGESLEMRGYSIFLHPTQWRLFGSAAVGVVLGNFMVVCAVAVTMSLVVRALSVTKAFAHMDTLGLCRFPSAPLFVFQFLLLGTAMASMSLLFYPPSASAAVLGAVSLAVCILVPIALVFEVRCSVPSKGFYKKDAATEDRQYLTAMIGPGEWVSQNTRTRWSLRYASVVRPYRQEWACYVFVEMAATLTIAAVSGATAESMVGCGHKKLCDGLIFLVLLTATCLTQPYARTRDLVAFVSLFATQAIAMLLMASGYYFSKPHHAVFSIAETILYVSNAILLAKVIADICSEGYVFCTKRRHRLMMETEAEHADTKELLTSCSSDDADTTQREKRTLDTSVYGPPSVVLTPLSLSGSRGGGGGGGGSVRHDSNVDTTQFLSSRRGRRGGVVPIGGREKSFSDASSSMRSVQGGGGGGGGGSGAPGQLPPSTLRVVC